MLNSSLLRPHRQIHANHSLAALETGRHVLTEKPMATALEDADRMACRRRECEQDPNCPSEPPVGRRLSLHPADAEG